MDRKPFFAGRFYAGSAEMLKSDLASFVPKTALKVNAMAIISPHAGYMYSGKVAGEIFSKINLPDKFIILSPNHTGMGEKISLWPSGSWKTPLGKVKIDEDISKLITSKFKKAKEDTKAHLMEHSLEVQIPFIQYFKDEFSMVPITLAHLSLEDCRDLGKTLATVIKESDSNILMVSSTDMTHYEDAKTAEKKDMLALKQIEEINPEGLYNTVRKESITMCGVVPTTCMLFAAKQMGAKKGTLVKYTNSGETSGDYDQVVGYAGMYVS